MPRSVVVMDNASIHSKARVTELMQAVGARVLFLQPYSPSFNPIEKVFGRLKAWLRQNRDFVTTVPPKVALHIALECVDLQTCA
jgi:transposase